MKKARFLTELWASRTTLQKNHVAGGWRVEQPLIYDSLICGLVTVPKGFETDFASVPRLPFMFVFFGDRVHAAAVIHDYLCENHYPECRLSWGQCADVFNEAMKASGAPWYQRFPMVKAVKLYGVTKRHCRINL